MPVRAALATLSPLAVWGPAWEADLSTAAFYEPFASAQEHLPRFPSIWRRPPKVSYDGRVIGKP